LFTLSHQVLADFCRCISKMSDNDSVIFRNSHDKFINFMLYAKSTEFYTEYSQTLSDNEEFYFGVKSELLASVVKKLSKKLPVEFELTKSRLLIKQGESEAKLPIAEPSFKPLNLEGFTKYDDPQFLKDLEFCAKAIKEDKRFKGILVEKQEFSTKLAKLGFASCAVAEIVSEVSSVPRIVISNDAALVLKGFKPKDRKALLLNDNVFGVELSSGVMFYSMLLNDKHPEDLFSMFGQEHGESFNVNKKALVGILESIHAVMGNDETGAMWAKVTNDTWRISCKTYKGTEVAENLVIVGDLSNAEDFGVHRKAMLEVLKALDVDELTIYLGTKSFVYMVAGNYKAALTKMSG
jgi:DNA polymerase III sliding clamp (beta) subunit (PCNA family)